MPQVCILLLLLSVFDDSTISVGPVWALRCNAPLIRFLILVLYISFTCLYHMLPHKSFFLYFFLTYLLPYLSFPLRTDPLHFQAECRKRQRNLALVFCVFTLCCSAFFDWCMRAFIVLGLVFSIPSQEIGLGKRLRNDPFCVSWM